MTISNTLLRAMYLTDQASTGIATITNGPSAEALAGSAAALLLHNGSSMRHSFSVEISTARGIIRGKLTILVRGVTQTTAGMIKITNAEESDDKTQRTHHFVLLYDYQQRRGVLLSFRSDLIEPPSFFRLPYAGRYEPKRAWTLAPVLQALALPSLENHYDKDMLRLGGEGQCIGLIVDQILVLFPSTSYPERQEVISRVTRLCHQIL